MILFFSSFLLLFYFVNGREQLVSYQENKILFDLPDLAIDFVDQNFQEIHLEAFKAYSNDIILSEKDSSKYGQLVWYSVGYPKIEIRKSTNEQNFNNTSIFTFNQKGFSMRVQMLNIEHKLEFVKLIKRKYQIDVDPSQIVNLAPTQFECKTSFYSSEKSKEISINGLVKNFQEYPLKVDFYAPKAKKCQCQERCLFEKHIKSEENLLNLEFDCEISSNDYFKKQFTLYTNHISFSQSTNSLIEELVNKKFQIIEEKLDQNSKELENLKLNLNEFEEKLIQIENLTSKNIENLNNFIQETNNALEVIQQNVNNSCNCGANTNFHTTTSNTITDKNYEVGLFIF